jgi:hypothetical protein
MRPMKRVFYLVAMVLFMAALTAPLGLARNGEALRVTFSGAKAATPPPTPIGPFKEVDKKVCVALPVIGADRGECPVGEYSVDNTGGGGAILVYLRWVLKLLSSAIGIVIVMMIVLSGLQYITSTGDPGRIKNAKGRLQNAIIALVLFLSMFAILNFLVPGGILK